jgi:hypothetical protein
MALDNLGELNEPIRIKMTPFQKILQTAEIGLLILAGFSLFFKRFLFDYHVECRMISFFGLFLLYVFLPIFLFRSQKTVEHFSAHFAGFLLFLSIIGLILRIESWPHALEVQKIPLVLFPLMVAALMIVNAKDKDKIDFYLRIAWRYLVILLPFLTLFGFYF